MEAEAVTRDSIENRARRWLSDAPAELAACRRNPYRAADPHRLRRFEERGRTLEKDLHELAGALARAATDAGVTDAALVAALESPERPSSCESATAGALMAAWAARRLADDFESAWHEFISTAASVWVTAGGGGFPGHPILGAALRIIRSQAGLSQGDLASRMGMSKAFISHIENYRRERKASLEIVADWTKICGRDLSLTLSQPSPPRLDELLSRWSLLSEAERSQVVDSISAALGSVDHGDTR